MAATTGVHRTIVIPFGSLESGNFNEAALLPQIATLVVSTTNLLVASVEVSYVTFFSYSSGAFHFGKGVQLDIFATVAGDGVIVSNLTAFQTAVGGSIATWSESISWGW